MVATAIAKPTPYFGPARTKYYLFAAAITDQTTGVPTRAELNAAADITPAVFSWEGGEFSANSQDAQDWSTLLPAKVPNFSSLSDVTLTGNADLAGADLRTRFAQDGTYNIARLDTGDTATRKMDVFFVTVASKTKQITTSGNAKNVFGLTTQAVFQDVTIPAA